MRSLLNLSHQPQHTNARRGHVASAFMLACVLLAANVVAQLPSIDRIDQSTGGRRGTEFTLQIEGLNLTSVNDVLFFEPGLEKRSLRINEDENVELTLFATPECRLGEHPFVLTGPRGAAEVRTLQVDPFPIVPEQEPNSEQDSAQAVSLPASITGIVEEGDEDTFRVTLKKGQRLSAEVVALPLGRYLFDALLEILDDRGNVLAKVDDSPLLKQDPIVSILAPCDGDFFVRIREAAFGGDLDSRYRIHLGDFARPTIAYPAGVLLNGPNELALLGDAKGPIAKRITRDKLSNVLTNQTIQVNVSEMGDLPCYVKLRTSELPNVLEVEPNNDLESATASEFGLSCSLNGILEEQGDVDHFAFEAKQGDAYEVSVFAARIGSPIDSMLTIYGPDQQQLTNNDDGFVHDSLVRFIAPATGRYTLKVEDHLKRGGPTSVYRVEFQPIQPELELRLPTTRGTMPQQMQSVLVPRGSAVPLMVSCRRQNFAQPVQLFANGLPEGVTFSSPAIESGTHLGVALFQADPSAQTGSHLIQIHGEASAGDSKAYGLLSQEVGLVFGQPRKTVYHSLVLNRMPLIVVEQAPFRLSVSTPAAPLVQRGRLDLQVEIDRDPDFAEEVTLQLAYAPPWIRGPEKPLRLDGTTSKASFSVFAEESAELRDWSLILTAKAETENGTLVIASEPFQVEVAEPYLQLAVDKTVVRQNAATEVRCQLDWRKADGASAIAELKGLPKGATSPRQTLVVGQDSITFPVSVSGETPAAIHNTLFVELSVPESSETVTHFLGHGGVLEVLEPGAKPREELSRLEILRRN